MISKTETGPGVVVIGGDAGQSIIPQATPLRRLHYFDGKFLRAPDLTLEQNALLAQVRMSNQAGGGGLVHGLSCSMDDGGLAIDAGLAIDPEGRLLHLPKRASIPIAALFGVEQRQSLKLKPGQIGFGDCSETAPDRAGPNVAGGYYLLVALHTEAYCGSEEVYGKLCEAACVGDSERPYITEGIIIQAIGLSLELPGSGISLGPLHERSRVASAYFRERRDIWPSLISRSGLESDIWCLGAQLAGGQSVPLALLAYQGGVVRFLDNWIARRERMETPSRQYWAGRMAMRPWPVFMAEVIQFQCQLPGALSTGSDKGEDDPCAPDHKLVGMAADLIEAMSKQLGAAMPVMEKKQGAKATDDVRFLAGAESLVPSLRELAKPGNGEFSLIDGGIVELPSAGWLPVDKTSTRTLNQQVRALLGKGVDLRFCVVRPDYVPHALEEAQHLERISLLRGLDDPDDLQQVDILVPNGRIEESIKESPGAGYVMSMDLAGSEKARLPVEKGPSNEEKITETGGVATEVLMRRIGLMQALRKAAQHQFVNPRRPSLGVEPASTAQGDLAGAARDEVAADGGYAFYFAGQSLVDRSTEGDKVIVPHKTIHPPLHKASVAAEGEISKARQGLDGSIEPRRSLWLEFLLDRDPYQVADGEKIRLEARVVYLSIEADPDDPVEIMDLHLYGRMRRTSRVLSGPVDSVFGEMDLDGSEFEPDEDQAPSPLRLTSKLRLDRDQDAQGQRRLLMTLESVKVNEQPQAESMRFERTWQSAQTSSYRLILGRRERLQTEMPGPLEYREIASGTLTLDTQVAESAHPMHAAAISALRRLDSLLKAVSFAQDASLALFPPPQAQQEELRIHAREDWVLFQRRRDKVCEGDRPMAQPAPGRVYQVYRIHARRNQDLEIIVEALRQDMASVLARYRIDSIRAAEFAPGVQALRTSPKDLLDPWNGRVPPAAEIRYGAIASRGEAFDEGSELAKARLENLVGVLSPGEQASVPLEHLSTYPSALTGGSLDGVIALVTLLPEDTTICHEVYRVELQQSEVGAFLKDMQVDWRAALDRDIVQGPDSASFTDGSSQLAGDSTRNLQEWWGKSAGGAPYLALSIVKSEDGAMPADQPYQGQTGAIAQALNGPDDIGMEVLLTDQDSGDCHAISVLFVDPERQILASVEVRAVVMEQGESASEMSSRISGVVKEKGTEDLGAVKVVPLTRVHFDDQGVATTEDLNKLKAAAMEAGLLNASGAPLSSHHEGVNAVKEAAGDTARLDQAKGLWDFLGLQGNLGGLSIAASMPVDLDMLTFIVPQPAPKTALMKPVYGSATTAPDDVVRITVPAIHADGSGEIVQDGDFATMTASLKEEGILLNKVEIVSDDANAKPVHTKRGQAMLKALQEAGVADADTKVVVRKPSVKERKLMDTGSTPQDTGFVLRMRPAG